MPTNSTYHINRPFRLNCVPVIWGGKIELIHEKWRHGIFCGSQFHFATPNHRNAVKPKRSFMKLPLLQILRICWHCLLILSFANFWLNNQKLANDNSISNTPVKSKYIASLLITNQIDRLISPSAQLWVSKMAPPMV